LSSLNSNLIHKENFKDELEFDFNINNIKADKRALDSNNSEFTNNKNEENVVVAPLNTRNQGPSQLHFSQLKILTQVNDNKKIQIKSKYFL
jgi:hypothetical protein